MDVSIAGKADDFEAALNLLREQVRAVADVRRQIMADRALRLEDPRHHHALLVQTMAEMGQLGRAISTLEAVSAGRIVVVPAAGVSPQVKAADLPPMARTTGLTAGPKRPGLGAPLGAWS